MVIDNGMSKHAVVFLYDTKVPERLEATNDMDQMRI
jgi:hypothetical protein